MAARRGLKSRFLPYCPYLGLAFVLIVVVLGLLALQQAEYLRTSVLAPAGGSDYQLVPQPDVGIGASELVEECPQGVSDEVSGDGDGSVLGIFDRLGRNEGVAVGACERGAVGLLPSEYGVKYVDSKKVTLVEGKDAAEILGVICGAKRRLPTCPHSALACARMKWSPDFVVNGLYDIVQLQPRRLYALMDGFVYPDKGASRGSPARAIYPAAAAGKEIVRADRFMNLWGLSSADRGKLDAWQNKRATAQLELAAWHEGVHWAIYKMAAEDYLEVVNHPPVAKPAGSPAALIRDVEAQLEVSFDKVEQCEKTRHEEFHRILDPEQVIYDVPVGGRRFQCSYVLSAARKAVEAHVDGVKCN